MGKKTLTVSLFGSNSLRILKKFLPYCLSPLMKRFCGDRTRGISRGDREIALCFASATREKEEIHQGKARKMAEICTAHSSFSLRATDHSDWRHPYIIQTTHTQLSAAKACTSGLGLTPANHDNN